MPVFQELWSAHPGHDTVCDAEVFEDQCAMRMGEALRACAVTIPSDGLRTCVGYNSKRFASHRPGHVRSSQQLARILRKSPGLLASGVSCQIFAGSINKNASSLKGSNGVVFIRNGWGSTDHIDVFNGATFELKGGHSSYRSRGQSIWFWAM